MLSLYHALLAQHSRQLASVNCAEQTIAQLHRYFEDVVVENNLAALVIESLSCAPQRSQLEMKRVKEVGQTASHAFYFVSAEDGLNEVSPRAHKEARVPILLPSISQGALSEHFIIIADARFSALLVSLRDETKVAVNNEAECEVFWSFEPDIVYSALEYLMARVSAERFVHSEEFLSAVRACTPKATSLQLTVSVTTKLVHLLQEQAAREVALSRIASTICNSSDLRTILQTTVNEIGCALKAQHTALRVFGEPEEEPPTLVISFCDGIEEDEERNALLIALDSHQVHLTTHLKHYVLDQHHNDDVAVNGSEPKPVAIVPLVYQRSFMGMLMVCSDDAQRIWQDDEIMLLGTVADQVAVAVHQARLRTQMEQQALTDSLTGCLNRRAFELQLERDLRLATRMRQPVSLIILNMDDFKSLNDDFGQVAGDGALRFIADTLRDELRSVDTAARYNEEEFAVILPLAGVEGAAIVAERLRARLSRMEIPVIGYISASFGVATFPLNANSKDQLVHAADRSLRDAKQAGRNRVCMSPMLPDALSPDGKYNFEGDLAIPSETETLKLSPVV